MNYMKLTYVNIELVEGMMTCHIVVGVLVKFVLAAYVKILNILCETSYNFLDNFSDTAKQYVV